jgi:hypothetical protein
MADEWECMCYRQCVCEETVAALVAERATTETLDREWRAACLAEQVLRQRVKVADDALDAERALSDTLAAALEDATAGWIPLPPAAKALAAWRVARGGNQ